MKFILKLIAILLRLFAPSPRPPKVPQKILLLMCHWLGDTFWAMQVIPAVKKNYPKAELYVGCKSFSVDLFNNLIDTEHIIVLNSVISDRRREKRTRQDARKDLELLCDEKFDLAIDLTGNRYSTWLLYRVNTPSVGLSINELSHLYSVTGPPFDYERHLRFRPWQTVNILFDCDSPRLPSRVTPQIDIKTVKAALDINDKETIAMLLPGAGWNEKQWDANNFIACGQYLESKGIRVIISGSQKEQTLCETIADDMTNPIVLTNNLKYTISVIPHLKFALSNDSGIAHLVAAANIPLVAVYLVTAPSKCGPIGNNVKIFTRENATVERIKKCIDQALDFKSVR